MNQEETQNNPDQDGLTPAPHESNLWVLTAQLVSKATLRYTPAGLPCCEFELQHEGLQTEAGKDRTVRCAVQAVAMGVVANQVDKLQLGCTADWSGFIALRSHKSKGLRFHVCAVRTLP